MSEKSVESDYIFFSNWKSQLLPHPVGSFPSERIAGLQPGTGSNPYSILKVIGYRSWEATLYKVNSIRHCRITIKKSLNIAVWSLSGPLRFCFLSLYFWWDEIVREALNKDTCKVSFLSPFGIAVPIFQRDGEVFLFSFSQMPEYSVSTYATCNFYLACITSVPLQLQHFHSVTASSCLKKLFYDVKGGMERADSLSARQQIGEIIQPRISRAIRNPKSGHR